MLLVIPSYNRHQKIWRQTLFSFSISFWRYEYQTYRMSRRYIYKQQHMKLQIRKTLFFSFLLFQLPFNFFELFFLTIHCFHYFSALQTTSSSYSSTFVHKIIPLELTGISTARHLSVKHIRAVSCIVFSFTLNFNSFWLTPVLTRTSLVMPTIHVFQFHCRSTTHSL